MSVTESIEHITLGQAAKIAPGRPSTNCLWRWCRRGVLARSGERVHLQHIRLGGTILTTAAWVGEFGRRLADSDAVYFRQKELAAQVIPPRDPRYGPPSRQRLPRRTPASAQEAARYAALEEELKREGL